MGKILKFRVWREQQESASEDPVPTLLPPKKVRLTPAQKQEMEKAMKSVKSKKEKKRVRQEYEYDGYTGLADPIDTEPAIEDSYGV
jgi:hypothetical protein